MRAHLVILLFLFWPSLAFSDWTMMLVVRASSDSSASLSFGIQSGAANGYDPNRDLPAMPYDSATHGIYASFHHPEWQAKSGGVAIQDFSRDLRGSLPQEYSFQVITRLPQATLMWPTPHSVWIPNTSFELHDPISGAVIDMSNRNTYTFRASGVPQRFTISVVEYDEDPPAPPSDVDIEAGESVLSVRWGTNSEIDLAGYRVHVGTRSGNYAQPVDVRKQTNYTIPHPIKGLIYYVAVSAYDKEGRESELSSEVAGQLVVVEVADEEARVDPGTGQDEHSQQGDEQVNNPSGRERQSSASLPRQPGPGAKSPPEESQRRRSPQSLRESKMDLQDSPQKTSEGSAIQGATRSFPLVLDGYQWKLMSIPLQVSSRQPFRLFAAYSAELKPIGWDAAKQEFCDLAWIKPGTGFLLKAGKGFAAVEGETLPSTPVSIPLVQGWNLIGNPFLKGTPMHQIQVRFKGQLSSVAEAQHKGVLPSLLQTYADGEIKSLPLDYGMVLKPWSGYWLEALQDCELVVYPGPIPSETVQTAKMAD